MYEERKNKVSLRNAILVVLLVTLFIFILVWLFPNKSLKKTSEETYANHLVSLENAAKDYFTADRMPSKVGETVKLTLGEMLEKKLVANIEGDAKCSLTESYVEITRTDKDYQLNVVLNCEGYNETKKVTIECKNCTASKPASNNKPQQQAATKYTVTFDSNGGSAVSAQTITKGQKATKPADPTRSGYTFAGWTLNGKAYDFNVAVNDNIKLVATWNKIEETNNNNNNNNESSSNDEVEVLYEYINEYVNKNYLPWSDWQVGRFENRTGFAIDTQFADSDTIEYNVIDFGWGSSQKGLIDCNMVDVDERYVADIKDLVADYSRRVETISATRNVTPSYTNWEYAGEEEFITARRNRDNTDTTKYEYNRVEYRSECLNCLNTAYMVYDVYTREAIENVSYSCPAGYDLNGTNCTRVVETGSTTPSCNVYGSDYNEIGGRCVKYGYTTVEKEVCETATIAYADYYYRTREYTATDKQSYTYRETNNDREALSKGYRLTGRICTFANGKKTCE